MDDIGGDATANCPGTSRPRAQTGDARIVGERRTSNKKKRRENHKQPIFGTTEAEEGGWFRGPLPRPLAESDPDGEADRRSAFELSIAYRDKSKHQLHLQLKGSSTQHAILEGIKCTNEPGKERTAAWLKLAKYGGALIHLLGHGRWKDSCGRSVRREFEKASAEGAKMHYSEVLAVFESPQKLKNLYDKLSKNVQDAGVANFLFAPLKLGIKLPQARSDEYVYTLGVKDFGPKFNDVRQHFEDKSKRVSVSMGTIKALAALHKLTDAEVPALLKRIKEGLCMVFNGNEDGWKKLENIDFSSVPLMTMQKLTVAFGKEFTDKLSKHRHARSYVGVYPPSGKYASWHWAKQIGYNAETKHYLDLTGVGENELESAAALHLVLQICDEFASTRLSNEAFALQIRAMGGGDYLDDHNHMIWLRNRWYDTIEEYFSESRALDELVGDGLRENIFYGDVSAEAVEAPPTINAASDVSSLTVAVNRIVHSKTIDGSVWGWVFAIRKYMRVGFGKSSIPCASKFGRNGEDVCQPECTGWLYSFSSPLFVESLKGNIIMASKSGMTASYASRCRLAFIIFEEVFGIPGLRSPLARAATKMPFTIDENTYVSIWRADEGQIHRSEEVCIAHARSKARLEEAVVHVYGGVVRRPSEMFSLGCDEVTARKHLETYHAAFVAKAETIPGLRRCISLRLPTRKELNEANNMEKLVRLAVKSRELSTYYDIKALPSPHPCTPFDRIYTRLDYHSL